MFKINIIIKLKCFKSIYKITLIHTIFNNFTVKTDASAAQVDLVENADKDMQTSSEKSFSTSPSSLAVGWIWLGIFHGGSLKLTPPYNAAGVDGGH